MLSLRRRFTGRVWMIGDIGDDDNNDDNDDDDEDQIGLCVRASKFSTSVANLQKQNVIDSFERLVHDHVNNEYDPCHNY